jgi:TetR/AcrR family macrolide resistance operon transcriptional repressor
MPRHKLQSDEDVLDLAHAILIERGAGALTLSRVAEQVGLSKATLVQRFGGKETLVRRIAERQIELTQIYLDSLPIQTSAAGLLQFLQTIVTSMGTGKHFAGHLDLALLEASDPELRALANQRYRLVQAAIAKRVPPTSDDPDAIATHLHAVIAGASMQWIVADDPNLSRFVMSRLDVALAYLGIADPA